MPIIPATWKAKEGDHKFKVSLGNLARACLKTKDLKKKG
jgi:hypothetical protein